MKPVEFRNKQPAPTEPGWYWARQLRMPHDDIEPVDVHYEDHPVGGRRLVVSVVSWNEAFGLEGFDWFGPVMEVREG